MGLGRGRRRGAILLEGAWAGRGVMAGSRPVQATIGTSMSGMRGAEASPLPKRVRYKKGRPMEVQPLVSHSRLRLTPIVQPPPMNHFPHHQSPTYAHHNPHRVSDWTSSSQDPCLTMHTNPSLLLPKRTQPQYRDLQFRAAHRRKRCQAAHLPCRFRYPTIV